MTHADAAASTLGAASVFRCCGQPSVVAHRESILTRTASRTLGLVAELPRRFLLPQEPWLFGGNTALLQQAIPAPAPAGMTKMRLSDTCQNDLTALPGRSNRNGYGPNRTTTTCRKPKPTPETATLTLPQLFPYTATYLMAPSGATATALPLDMPALCWRPSPYRSRSKPRHQHSIG